ncbi:MAG: hypothetical protein HXX17_01250 [Geobacteraceae bacterium]|nr:hypothetical protein [Geobacteraceae bacterium]
MSSNKIKLLESAQKNFLKGHYDRAVYEYRQLIQIEPSDLRHRQRVAEILTKANQKDEALKEYTSLAKIYVDSVHYLKAIAVYKQIQKIDPTNPETSLTLAALNEKQGLIGNASAEYAVAVQIFEKNSENLKALKALECMMSLDSSNSAVKLRLAEKYFNTGSEDKSFDIFVATLKDLKNRADENGFSLISERAIKLFGNRALDLIDELEINEFPKEEKAYTCLHTLQPPPSALSMPDITQSILVQTPIHPTQNELSVDLTAPVDSCDNEYIEEISPLEEDDIVQIMLPDSSAEWEEDIDLNFLDSDTNSLKTTIDPVFIIEEELDELELELELEDNTASDPTPLFQQNGNDLVEALSNFADEIDFNLLKDENSGTVFDISSSGLKKCELDNEDTESHYSLGLAYKEMGLYDEAISEFIFSARATERRIDSTLLQCVCFREIGNIQKAKEMLSETIKDREVTDDELLGLQYELALCHEDSGELLDAINLYSNIVNVRPKFSDAASRLNKLLLNKA